MGKLGNYGKVASLSSQAGEEFETAELWFDRAEGVRYMHKSGVRVMTENEIDKVVDYNAEHSDGPYVGIAYSRTEAASFNKYCSHEMSKFSSYLSDDFVKAEKNKRLLENILNILKVIL